jgi:6-phosphofructokinase 1
MRVGVLTGGGDCPGLNAVIRAVVRKGVAEYGYEFIGFRDGWKGPLEGLTSTLGIAEVRGILPRGGTILGSSRTNPMKVDGGVDKIKANLAAFGVDALIAIGGEDTLGVATKLHDVDVPVVGVPKTIDNDYMGIDFTFGYFTAVDTLGGEIRNLLYDAEASRAYFLCETMGRSAGWLSYGAAISGEASLVISVEDIHGKYRGEETVSDSTGQTRIKPVMNVDEVVGRIVKTMRVREEHEGKPYGVIVLAVLFT